MPNESPKHLLLIGSSSKWRRAVLQRFFAPTSEDAADRPVVFETMLCLSPDIDEDAIEGDTPEALCVAIAEAKMDKILALLSGVVCGPSDDASLACLRQLYAQCRASTSTRQDVRSVDAFWIVCGDQVAVFEGVVRQKPVDEAENREFLRSYRGNSIHTVAGTVLVDVVSGLRRHAVNHTTTSFREDLPDDVIDRVVERGDSMQCCGGFVVEDVELASYIASIEPSLDAVTGVDVHVVAKLMRDMIAERSSL